MEQKVFKDNGQPPIEPPEGDGNIPQELMGIVAIKEEKRAQRLCLRFALAAADS